MAREEEDWAEVVKVEVGMETAAAVMEVVAMAEGSVVAARVEGVMAGSTVGSVGMGVELVAFLVAGMDLACSKSGPLSRGRQIWATL